MPLPNLPLPTVPELHGAFTHFPVALLMAGAAFDILALFSPKREWKTVAFWMLATGVLLALPAIGTGLATANQLFRGPARPPSIFYYHRAAALTAATLALIGLAWRTARRNEMTGGARTGALALSIAAALSVGFAGYLGGHMVFGDESQSPETTSVGTRPAKAPSNAENAAHAAENARTADPQLLARGETLFRSSDLACMSCHRYQGQGGQVGPDLTHEGQRHPDPRWHIAHLKDPASVNPRSTMPAFDTLRDADLRALAAFLASRR